MQMDLEDGPDAGDKQGWEALVHCFLHKHSYSLPCPDADLT